MRVLLITPRSFDIPAQLLQALGNPTVLHATQHDTVATNLELPQAEGIIFLLASPQLVDLALIKDLYTYAQAAHAEGKNVAFVPGQGEEKVLATAAAAYAFDAKAVHLAGGFDSTLTAVTLGIDMQVRLGGRAHTIVRCGHKAITGIPEVDSLDYLKILTKNLTSTRQAPYLAPLFTGIIDHSLRVTGTDTSVLDLQRSPGGDEIPTLSHPAGALRGAQTIRLWGEALQAIETSKYIVSESRRIPDRRMPYLDAFVDEIWASTGIPSAQRELLELAFSDLAPTQPSIAVAAPSNSDRALSRLHDVANIITEPLYWWDPHEVALYEREENGWKESTETIDDIGKAISILYAIESSVREIPWAGHSPCVFISDLSTLNLAEQLTGDWVGLCDAGAFSGSSAQRLYETLLRADHVITDSQVQRDFVLGALAGLHRIDQYTYDEDHSLDTLVSVEQGTSAALNALNRPIHPLGRVRTTPEYERSPFATLAESSQSFVDTIKHAPRRAFNKVKGLRK